MSSRKEKLGARRNGKIVACFFLLVLRVLTVEPETGSCLGLGGAGDVWDGWQPVAPLSLTLGAAPGSMGILLGPDSFFQAILSNLWPPLEFI